ncbi:MAG TPA: hypothetical protein VMF69_05260 [Gemmataceae bacterium]|nr:hypothetical protein [Gemmataceae bacterium]
MTTQRFFDNPHFRTYVRLLQQLHRLIRDGVDETAEGEVLRERMDEPARDLSQEEIDCLNGISADFYTLGDPPRQIQPSSPTARQEWNEMQKARESQDFVRALDLLRRNQTYHHAATVAYERGNIWSEAEEKEIAGEFFQRAKELGG